MNIGRGSRTVSGKVIQFLMTSNVLSFTHMFRLLILNVQCLDYVRQTMKVLKHM